jgi:hypothetical protein
VNDKFLSYFETVMKENPRDDYIYRIEHFGFSSKE